MRLPDPSIVWGVLGRSKEGEGSVAPSQGSLSILTYLRGFTISTSDHQLQAPWLTSSCSMVIPEVARRVIVPGVPGSRVELRLAVHPSPQASLYFFPAGGKDELVLSLGN